MGVAVLVGGKVPEFDVSVGKMLVPVEPGDGG